MRESEPGSCNGLVCSLSSQGIFDGRMGGQESLMSSGEARDWDDDVLVERADD